MAFTPRATNLRAPRVSATQTTAGPQRRYGVGLHNLTSSYVLAKTPTIASICCCERTRRTVTTATSRSSSSMTSAGLICKGASSASAGRNTAITTTATATTTITTTTTQDLEAALQDIRDLSEAARQVPVTAEQLAPHIEEISSLAAELGLDVVQPQWIDGNFRAVTLTGLKGVSKEFVTTLGQVTFGLCGPNDLQVSLRADSESADWSWWRALGLPQQYRGPLEGEQQGFCLYNPFSIVPDDKDAPHGQEKPKPLHGLQTALGRYSVDTDQPHKMVIDFTAVRIQPSPYVAGDPVLLQRWLELLQPHNPVMGDDGVATVPLSKPPRGTHEYVVMTETLGLFKGNLGSYSLVERC